MNDELRIKNYELRIMSYKLRCRRLCRNSLFVIRYLVATFLLIFVLPSSFFLLPSMLAQAPEVVAVWEGDGPSEMGWTVGDVISLRLRVVAPESFEVALPELPEQWGDFEVREQSVQEPMAEAGQVVHVLAVTAVLWSPGVHATPELQVAYRDAAGETHAVDVPPLTIDVASVLVEVTPNAEGAIDKYDLKAQAELPRPPLWPWILAGLLAALLLYFGGRWLWRRLPRRKKAELELPREPVDDRPPDVIAYTQLDYIAALDLPAQGAFKQHYSLVTDCVRAYLEGRYAVPALDQTTYQLMRALRKIKFKGEPLTLLRNLLDEADLVKFAKFEPAVEPAQVAITHARRLVEITTSEEAGDRMQEAGYKRQEARGRKQEAGRENSVSRLPHPTDAAPSGDSERE